MKRQRAKPVPGVQRPLRHESLPDAGLRRNDVAAFCPKLGDQAQDKQRITRISQNLRTIASAAPAPTVLANSRHSAHTARFELVVGWSFASVQDAFYFPDWSI
jgi:hypothetical protein